MLLWGLLLLLHVYAFAMFLLVYSFAWFCRDRRRSGAGDEDGPDNEHDYPRSGDTATMPRIRRQVLHDVANASGENTLGGGLDGTSGGAPHVVAVHALHRVALRRRLPAITANNDDDDDDESDDEWREMYGVSPVSPTRAARLGLRRRVRGYERKGAIYLPQVSSDTKRCDLWNTRRDIDYLVRCRVSDGEQACFACMESRRFVRHCVHLPRPIRLATDYARTHGGSSTAAGNDTDEHDGWLDVPANLDPDEGYCLPGVFRETVLHGDGYRPRDETRNCNPNTGDWLLARLGTSDSTYNWLCHCRYPNLVTNDTTVFSDCTRAVGCNPYGELDEKSRAGLVDPWVSGRCLCRAGYANDRDPTVGPVCVPRAVVSSDGTATPQELFNRYGLDGTQLLSWPADREYLDDRLPALLGDQFQLPNPCHYDALTGRRLPSESRCLLTKETSDEDRASTVAFCVMTHPTGLAVRSSRDYLRNNNGRFANACVLVDRVVRDQTTNTDNTVFSYQASRDQQEPRPDFGVLYPASNTLQRMVDGVADDPAYKRFRRHVTPPAKVTQRFVDAPDTEVALGDISRWISAYQQNPIDARNIAGLQASTLSRWRKRQPKDGVIYNLRWRDYYWYNVTNPLGNVHWNNGKASEWNSLLSTFSGLYPVEFLDAQIQEDRAWVRSNYQDRPADFQVSGSNASRRNTSAFPDYYPPRPLIAPFASGSAIDDKAFSADYYFTLSATFSPSRETPPSDVRLFIPWTFNTRSDRFDSTVTMHVARDAIYMAAEQLLGEYKNHRRLMYHRLQGKWV